MEENWLTMSLHIPNSLHNNPSGWRKCCASAGEGLTCAYHVASLSTGVTNDLDITIHPDHEWRKRCMLANIRIQDTRLFNGTRKNKSTSPLINYPEALHNLQLLLTANFQTFYKKSGKVKLVIINFRVKNYFRSSVCLSNYTISHCKVAGFNKKSIDKSIVIVPHKIRRIRRIENLGIFK